MKISTHSITKIALFAAITATFSQIILPLPFTPVPINLGMLAVFLAGGLLTPRAAITSQLVYLAVGAMGVPVFAGFSGGLGHLFGPTGGYLLGYVLAAGIISLLKSQKAGHMILIMCFGLVLCYGLGTIWFMQSTSRGFVESLSLCVLPFLPGDFLKIVTATVLVKRLNKILPQ